MNSLRIGSLFSGYGGIDVAVQVVFPAARPAWFVERDAAPAAILAHHWPDTPNFGDITAIDWGTVPPVDILTGGYPCQPFSHAGRRKGEADERHLWPYVREAIRHLRPRYVFLENVAGHRSLGFDQVLGDMAKDGLHAWWTSLRASDIGAPHHRERLFILAAFPDSESLRRDHGQAPHAGPRLSAAFSEWMMGLPLGHVTGVPGLSRTAQLKAIGNGVCPQQAAVALQQLLAMKGE